MMFIRDLQAGTDVKETYLCTAKRELTTKAGKPYYDIILADKTGTVNAKIWEPDNMPDFDVNDFITVSASVGTYNNALQLAVKEVKKAEEIDFKNYLAHSKYSDSELDNALKELINSVETPCFSILLRTIFKDGVRERFLKHPAAKSMHHNVVGGLAQHTIDVAGFCSDMSYNYPVNRDLVVTAALLHDIGKLEEIEPMPCNNYTTKGLLLGHISIGVIMVSEYIRQIRNFGTFPETEEQELLHCILAHHGKLEYGSPVKPALLEAVMLSYADETDAKLEGFIEGVRQGTVDKNGWSGWSKMFNGYLKQTASRSGTDKEQGEDAPDKDLLDMVNHAKKQNRLMDSNPAQGKNEEKQPASVLPFHPHGKGNGYE